MPTPIETRTLSQPDEGSHAPPGRDARKTTIASLDKKGSPVSQIANSGLDADRRWLFAERSTTATGIETASNAAGGPERAHWPVDPETPFGAGGWSCRLPRENSDGLANVVDGRPPIPRGLTPL